MKPCSICAREFEPTRPMQRVCSLACAKAVPVIARKEKRAELSKRKEKAKRRADLVQEAQQAFNAYIRYRDVAAGHGCIDCGLPFEPDRPGGSVDAGHYLSRSQAPHLRFDERNVFAQRKNCNRPGGTTRMQFRAGVIARIGLDAVEALECDQAPRKHSHDDLRAIRDDYRAKLRALKARDSLIP